MFEIHWRSTGDQPEISCAPSLAVVLLTPHVTSVEKRGLGPELHMLLSSDAVLLGRVSADLNALLRALRICCDETTSAAKRGRVERVLRGQFEMNAREFAEIVARHEWADVQPVLDDVVVVVVVVVVRSCCAARGCSTTMLLL